MVSIKKTIYIPTSISTAGLFFFCIIQVICLIPYEQSFVSSNYDTQMKGFLLKKKRVITRFPVSNDYLTFIKEDSGCDQNFEHCLNLGRLNVLRCI